MRFIVVEFLLTLVVALAVAGPVSKISEKKFLDDNTKLVKEVPKIEEIGDEKDRSKKSTTTFCVEIRPGSNEPVQIPCACKNKEEKVPQLTGQQISDNPALYLSPQSVPAHQHSPQSVNIIHAPSQPPQTLNIIQPAPTLHAVQFLQPQGNNPPAVQTLNFLQPSAQLPEPAHQSLHITLPSKPESELSEPAYSEKIVLPPSESAPLPLPKPESQPESQPAPQPEHGEQIHKSEVHVSVMTEDKKDKEEQKPYSEVIVHSPPSPVETVKVVPVAPIRQPYEEQVVVVPNPVLVTNQQENCPPTTIVQVPSVPYAANYESVIPVSGSTYQQSGPFHTECSCKQTHPAHPTDASSSLRTHFKEKGTKIIPMVFYPPAAPSVSVASPVHYKSELASVSSPSVSHPSGFPMVISMQTSRSKDGMQPEEMSDMKTYKPMDASARYSYDQTPNMYYDMSSGMQLMDMGRQAVPTLENQREEVDMKTSGLLNENLMKSRFTRNDKDAKMNEKIIEEKTSLTKTA